jgi:hypothetical protein
LKSFWKILVVMAVMLSLVVVPATVTAVSYTNSVTLENKTGDPDWYVVADDDYSATLQYNASGITFDFYLGGKVPVASDNYSLIYYADPWAGNNPGGNRRIYPF